MRHHVRPAARIRTGVTRADARSRRHFEKCARNLALVVLVLLARAADGQNQFGFEDRADAARRLITLAVQQAISSLPPTSGQAFTYEFDPALGTFVPSERLGPVALRSAQTVGAGNWGLRLAGSYFELSEKLGPIDYLVEGPVVGFLPDGQGRTRFGLDVGAHVGIVEIGATYGVTDAVEVAANLPLVVADADAKEVYIAAAGSKDVFAVRLQPPDLIDRFLASGDLVVVKTDFPSGAGFTEDTNVGVGRISLGTKWLAYPGDRVQLALGSELFLPSPNEQELAGSESVSILPRAVAQYAIVDWATLLADVGYEHDFENAELSRFVWNVGASIAFERVTFDLGMGGSKFNEGLEWTPHNATFLDFEGNQNQLTALEDNRLGSNFVDFLFGLRWRVSERAVLSGAVSVPVNGEGLRPAAVGTIAAELYL